MYYVFWSYYQTGGETFDCIKNFDSFRELYASLEPAYQPTLAKLFDSDEAFGRERVTNSPLFMHGVKTMDELPFKGEDVVGLDEIIAPTGKTLDQLVADKQVSNLGDGCGSVYVWAGCEIRPEITWSTSLTVA